MDTIIKILERSIEKNGVQPLTTSHLLHILKLAKKIENDEEEKYQKFLDEKMTEIDVSRHGDQD